MQKFKITGFVLALLLLFTSCVSNKEVIKSDGSNSVNVVSEFRKTQNDEEILSKYFKIRVAEGTVVSENIGELFDIIAEDVVTITGLKLYPEGYSEENKIIIEVQRDLRAQCNDDTTIYLTEEEVISWNGNSHVFAHELTHCMQFRNYQDYNVLVDEGYATYITKKYAEQSQIQSFYAPHFSLINYTLPDANLVEQTVADKAIYIEGQYNMETYAVAFRLFNFLQENYGEDIILKCFENMKGTDYTEGSQITSKIKESTSEDVFLKFADWYKDNKDQFENPNVALDYSRFNTLYIMPLRYENVWHGQGEDEYYYYFNPVNGCIKDEIILDFKYGKEYYKTAENKTLENLAINFSTDKACEVTLYDSNGKAVEIKKVTAGEELLLQNKDIASIKIKGECSFKAEIKADGVIQPY